ncbi:MAG: TRAP transporter small permease [Deltaproteobacteria bacterium]|nr:TRAP transporter small permease [Deltaproteobacteria bacterium]
MKSILDSVEKFLGLFVSVLIGAMMLWTFALVITRYCFNFTPSYGEELARYMFVWVVFLSLPIVAKKGAHMAIEMITIRLKGRALKTLRLISGTLTLIFLVLMVYQGSLLVLKSSIQTSAALQIPMSWVYIAIPVGCLIMLVNVLGDFLTLLRTPADQL